MKFFLSSCVRTLAVASNHTKSWGHLCGYLVSVIRYVLTPAAIWRYHNVAEVREEVRAEAPQLSSLLKDIDKMQPEDI